MGRLNTDGEILNLTLVDGDYLTLAKTTTSIEFELATASGLETDGDNLPRLLVDGVLMADTDFDLTLNNTGTATLGTDYTFGGATGALPQTVTVTLAAGTYSSATPVDLSSLVLASDGTTAFAMAITPDINLEADENGRYNH